MSRIDDLIAQYDHWNQEQGLQLGSADEHLTDPSLTPEQRSWLADFCVRWDDAQKLEDEREWLERRRHPYPTLHLHWRVIEPGMSTSWPEVEIETSEGSAVLMQWWEYQHAERREALSLPLGEWREIDVRLYPPTQSNPPNL